jgi:hypothetical protein
LFSHDERLRVFRVNKGVVAMPPIEGYVLFRNSTADHRAQKWFLTIGNWGCEHLAAVRKHTKDGTAMGRLAATASANATDARILFFLIQSQIEQRRTALTLFSNPAAKF